MHTDENGRQHWLLVSATPFQGGSTAIAGGIATAQDITERKRAESAEAANQFLSALAHEERLTTAGEMAAGLAHELNQPLTAITYFCDYAASIVRGSRIRRRAELVEALDDIDEQSHRAADIIASLRRFVGRLDTRRAPQDINGIVEETVRFAGWTIQNAGGQIDLELADHLPHVTVDRTQIHQVLMNLIRNASAAMLQAGSDPRAITIVTATADDDTEPALQVTVGDTGPGVPADTAHQVFAPYQSSTPNSLGLGLWISRSIIEAHGGRLWADFDAPGGLFHFTLPVENDAGA